MFHILFHVFSNNTDVERRLISTASETPDVIVTSY